jgi:predicted RNase H-like nuclease (RuvC/YqgF family)
MDDQMVKERVSGLSGLGLAEEQRVKKAMHGILTGTAATATVNSSVEQLRIQATRLAVTINRHLADQKYLREDIARIDDEIGRTSEKCRELESEVEEWQKRNRLYEEYDCICRQILATGPPVQVVEREVEAIDAKIAQLEKSVRHEQDVLQQDANRISTLLHEMSTIK